MKQLLTLVLVLAAAPLDAADAPAPGIPIVGVGLVSADHKTVFLPSKDGIEAVDVASGRALWTNNAAPRLAGVSNKRVLAWLGDEKKANVFRVVVLDAETGKTLLKSDPIEMPDWANTTKIGGRSFMTAATADGDAVTVVWKAGAFYFGGAAPTEEILAAAKKDASAVVSVDLKSGKVAGVKRKPVDDDFKLSPAGAFNNKLGDYEFRVEEQIPGFKPGAPMVTKVTFTTLKGGKAVWVRELVGNPWSPPPP